MQAWKKGALGAAVVLLLLVLALAIVPYLFRDRIGDRVRAGIDRSVEADVDFGSVGLTLFRDFPHFTFSLNDLAVTGVEAFQGDTLVRLDELGLVIDLRSAVGAYRHGDPLVIRSITVERPDLRLRILEDGRASWDIVKAVDRAGDAVVPGSDDVAVPEDAPYHIELRRFVITDGRIAIDDAATGLRARLEGVEHSLSGDFTRERFSATTTTRAEAVTVHHLGVPYVNEARLEADAELDADMAERRFTFRDNRLALNELAVGFDGRATLEEEGGVDLELSFAAHEADLRQLLSLVPALYVHDFPSLEASGDVDVAGHVRGRYAPDHFPSFRIDVQVADGTFRYADLPLSARGIALDLAVANPGGDPDATRIDLSRFDITFGEDAFHATGGIRTPVSDPDIDLTLSGRLDLGALSRTVPLEGVEELSGTVTTDATIATRLSYLDAHDYDRVEARGTAEARNVALRSEDLPHPIEVAGMRIELSPRRAELHELEARVGASDFQATGVVDNLLGFALRDEELSGRATVTSRFIDLDEWRSDDEALEVIPVPANLDVALEATVDRMRLGELELRDARGAVRLADQRVTLEEFAFRTLEGEMVLTGFYETTAPARPTFDLDLGMSGIDIPAAFRTLSTVRALAPAAEYATGRFSGDLRMSGPLGPDLVPVFEVLDGLGTVTTAGVAIREMPVLHRVADALRIDRLRDPRLSDFTSSVAIRDGRLHVQPFDVRMAGSRMTVSGSNGLDQSLDYRLLLEVPRSELGTDASRVVTGILAEADRRGLDLAPTDSVRLHVILGGTMTRPTVGVDLADVAAAGREAASAIIAEAEAQATRVREEAARLAQTVREEGNARADRLLDQASNPIARRAAVPAADRIRREAETRALGIIDDADARAELILAAARRRADPAIRDTGPDTVGRDSVARDTVDQDSVP